MTINLQKDQKVNLGKEAAGSQKFTIGLGWSANAAGGAKFDLDAAAFMLTNVSGTAKLTQEPNFVFYGNLKSLCGGVVHAGDNLTGDGDGDDEQIHIDFGALDKSVDEIAIVVAIYDAANRGQYFGKVKNAYVRIVDAATNQEVARYDLTDDYSADTMVKFGSLYQKEGSWRFAATGEGFKPESGRTGGFQDLIAFYS